MTVPAFPAPFTTPVINPNVGGYGRALQYLSVSSYKAAPTALDLSNLVSNSTDDDGFDNEATDASQNQALDDVLRRASRIADRFVFGADASGKDASLCMTQTVEGWRFNIKPNGVIPVICDYKPIVEVDGMSIGFGPDSLVPLTPEIQAKIEFGRRTIYVPIGTSSALGSAGPRPYLVGSRPSSIYVLWSYWNGYAHLKLAAPAEAGDMSIVVSTNGPNNVVKGVYPNTQLSIYDMVDLSSPGVEDITVASVVGTTINLASPLLYDHQLPEAPDFIPVSAIPADVGQAVIFLASALIKSRGDNSITLDDISEPSELGTGADSGIISDVKSAWDILCHFQPVSKVKN